MLCASNENKRLPFEAGCRSSSITQEALFKAGITLGRSLAVVDTPGFFDTSVPLETTMQEVSRCMFLLSPGPHIILLVIKIGRFTGEVIDAINTIKEVFGPESMKHTIVVFTGYDNLERDDISIEEYVEELEENCKNLIEECGDRYIAIDNTLKPNSKDNIQQIKALLEMGEALIRQNNGSCYSNEMLQEASMILQAKREKTEREIKRKEEEQKLLLQRLEQLENMKDQMGQEIHTISKETEALRKKVELNKNKAQEEVNDGNMESVNEDSDVNQELFNKDHSQEMEQLLSKPDVEESYLLPEAKENTKMANIPTSYNPKTETIGTSESPQRTEPTFLGIKKGTAKRDPMALGKGTTDDEIDEDRWSRLGYEFQTEKKDELSYEIMQLKIKFKRQELELKRLKNSQDDKAQLTAAVMSLGNGVTFLKETFNEAKASFDKGCSIM